jgi:hypothetical protein
MLDNVTEEGLVETLSCGLVECNVLEELVEDGKAGVGYIPHSMFEGPDNGIQDELELGWGDSEVGWEAVVGHSLEKTTTMASNIFEKTRGRGQKYGENTPLCELAGIFTQCNS